MCREDAVKLALFVGGFTGSYHLLRGGLQQWVNQSHTQACFTAGCLAGKSWGSVSGLSWLHSLSTSAFLQPGTDVCYTSWAFMTSAAASSKMLLQEPSHPCNLHCR